MLCIHTNIKKSDTKINFNNQELPIRISHCFERKLNNFFLANSIENNIHNRTIMLSFIGEKNAQSTFQSMRFKQAF